MTNAFESLATFIAAAPFPVMMVLKATVILLIAWLFALLLGKAAASIRYAVWALALAAVLALPIGMIVGPAWRFAIATTALTARTSDPTPRIEPAALVADGERISAAVDNGVPMLTTSAEPGLPATASPAIPISGGLLPILFLLGVLTVVARMAIGRMILARITGRAESLDDDDWQRLLLRESERAGVSKTVRLFASAEVCTPLTTGTRAPVILLPADARTWAADHREVVLRHELIHIASRDTTVCIVAGFACALYWFHPLVWLAARRLRTEQERTCDDGVLTLGTPAADYAGHLLDVARSAQSLGMHGFVSVAMARPTQLEGRLLAVLSDTRSRTPLTKRRVIAASVVAALLMLLVSAFRPVIANAAVVVASQGNLTTSLALPPANVVAVSPGVGASASFLRQRADSVVTREIEVPNGGTIVLELKTGAAVNITTWDQPRLRMRASLGGRDWRHTEVKLEPDGRGARLHMFFRDLERRNQSSSHHIDLTVPRRFNVRISSAGGGITLRNIEGDFTGSTGGGAIIIDHARGHARLTTGGGAVTVTDSHLSGDVSTGGGGVLLQGITGGLTGHSGSGEVFHGEKGVSYTEVSDGVRRASDGRLYVRKAGGRVTIGEAPEGASVSTGGGAIRIGRADGEVTARTGGGDVIIGPARGSVDAGTGAGDVTITLSSENAGPIDVKSGNGTVTLIVPRGFGANLDLETAYTNNRRRGATRIVSDWDLDVTETREWDDREGTPRRYVRARQSIGGGGRTVRVKTVNGNIVIRRER